jgi:hypothetical protein
MRTFLFAAGLIGFSLVHAAAAQELQEQPREPQAAQEAQNVMILTGAEVAKDTAYTYLGMVAPFAGNSLENGYVYRLWADYSKYSYTGGDVKHDADAPSISGAVGYVQSGEGHWWGAYAGLVYRHTSISPDDLSSSSRGGKLRPNFSLEGEQELGPDWRVGAMGSYTVGQRAYWTRGSVSRVIGDSRRLGVEAIAQGDPSYHASQYGVFLSGIKIGSVELGFKVGARHQGGGLGTDPYFGIELLHM